MEYNVGTWREWSAAICLRLIFGGEKMGALRFTVVLIILAAGAATPLIGDDNKKESAPKQRSGVLPQHWSKLGLSEDQKRKVYAVQADYRARIDDLKQQLEDMKKKEQTELYKVLTDAQKSRLRE